MKANFFSVSYVLLLITSIIIYSGENLPFIKGKYIYWLPLLTLTAFIFILRNKSEILKITVYDIILFLLTAVGTIHFIYFSKATIYNTTIWNYIGYLTIYLLLRNYCRTTDISKKALHILLYFCSVTAVVNIFLMFLQWNHWISSPNEFFRTTGLFFSPNQLGIYLSIGCLSSLFLLQKANALWLKIALGISLLLVASGLFVTESRGAFISLCIATVYYFLSGAKTKSLFNWKTSLALGILIAGSFYFISIINKNKTDSTSGRYFTTQQVIKQIAQNPLGYGANSFSLEYNKAKAQYFENNSKWEEMKNAGYIYFPNNDFLELTFELGILWISIFGVFILLLFIKKSDSFETAICRTILLCLIIFALTNNILILPVFAIIACICSVIIINTNDIKVIYELKNRGIYKFAGVGLILSFAFIQIARINAEHKLYKLYEGKMYLIGENQLQGYLSKVDNKGEELFMGGIILMKNGYQKEGMNYMQTGFERSGKPSIGKILANGLQKQKKFAEAETIYTYNKNAEPYRYEARIDLLKLFIETRQYAKAKKMAQEIIDLPVKIPSVAIDDFKKKSKVLLTQLDDK